MADMNIEEPTCHDATFSERESPSDLSYLPFFRACIRLHMILERVCEKINMPSCTLSRSILDISFDMGKRRIKDTTLHDDGCISDHTTLDFEREMYCKWGMGSIMGWETNFRPVLEKYRTFDLPPTSELMEDDNVYHCQVERIRTITAFIKILIYRHLFGVANSDLAIEEPTMRYSEELLRNCQTLLASQKKMLQRGSFTGKNMVAVKWTLSAFS
jgi:hypothetical protein